jgi:hypothetical protein
MQTDEHYIIVQVWDETLGTWADVDEARDLKDARGIAMEEIAVDRAKHVERVYRIHEVKNTIVHQTVFPESYKA